MLEKSSSDDDYNNIDNESVVRFLWLLPSSIYFCNFS